MTICGFSLVEADRALAWSDAEIFRDDQPRGRVCKITIGLAGVLIGAGAIGVVTEAGDAFRWCETFDSAVETLPGALRVAAHSVDRLVARPAGESTSSTVVVVGHSQKYDRIVGAIFSQRADFEPFAPAVAWTMPRLDEIIDPDDAAAVAEIAERQLERLCREIPAATGGTLMVAEVRLRRITTHLVEFPSARRSRSRQGRR